MLRVVGLDTEGNLDAINPGVGLGAALERLLDARGGGRRDAGPTGGRRAVRETDPRPGVLPAAEPALG